MDPNEYVGLTKKAAQDKAERKNAIFRLIRIDADKFFEYPDTTDVRTDRICVEIDGGKVTKATVT
jgi:hypothetical protein